LFALLPGSFSLGLIFLTSCLIKFFANSGKLTAGVKGQFTGITKRAFAQFINEHITERLCSAMGEVDSLSEAKGANNLNSNHSVAPYDSENKIVTTEEDIQGYYIVRGIICSVLDIERIISRDTQSYFGILCDNNNRRPICRLYFNGRQKYISIFNMGAGDKNEEKIPIANLNEIHKLADRLKATAEHYINLPC